eukprot:CAMPEP_0178916360 /NCGR_PEP_ID=MMETSP0786-20121207/12586_1 /TAXON_ID=186022 /ORGANISM="Thalassionema frauenfeldii, Strain CCMP 1798" /LENGTH=388 /DNA_ID=CAMNT_0020589667 /DNA_START=380 /DNA_END=1544 /DNA_ORIENTATION=+
MEISTITNADDMSLDINRDEKWFIHVDSGGEFEFLHWTRGTSDPKTSHCLSLSKLPVQQQLRTAKLIELQSKLYLICNERKSKTTDTWVFDNGSWHKGPSLRIPRESPTVVALNDTNGPRILVIGGTVTINNGKNDDGSRKEGTVSEVEVWNLSNSEYEIIGTLPFTETASALCLDGILYLFFGNTTGTIHTLHSNCLVSNPKICSNSGRANAHVIMKKGDNKASRLSQIPRLPPLPQVPMLPSAGGLNGTRTPKQRVEECQSYIQHLKDLQDDHRAIREETRQRTLDYFEAAQKRALQQIDMDFDTWCYEIAHCRQQAKDAMIEAKSLQKSQEDFVKALHPMKDPKDGKDCSEIPPQLVCPITLSVMKNPVVASDGNVYDKNALEIW